MQFQPLAVSPSLSVISLSSISFRFTPSTSDSQILSSALILGFDSSSYVSEIFNWIFYLYFVINLLQIQDISHLCYMVCFITIDSMICIIYWWYKKLKMNVRRFGKINNEPKWIYISLQIGHLCFLKILNKWKSLVITVFSSFPNTCDNNVQLALTHRVSGSL